MVYTGPDVHSEHCGFASGRADYDVAACGSRDRAFDEKQVAFLIHSHDLEILDGDFLETVSSWHVVTTVGLMKALITCDRPRSADVHRAVRLWTTMLVPPLDHAAESSSFRYTCDRNRLDILEDVNLDYVTGLVIFSGHGRYFADETFGFLPGLLEMAEHGFCDLFRVLLEADLECGISISLGILHL